jgi:hypothetical protein
MVTVAGSEEQAWSVERGGERGMARWTSVRSRVGGVDNAM